MVKALMIIAVCLGSVVAVLLAGCGKEEVPPVSPPPVEADFSRSGPPAVTPRPTKPATSTKPLRSATGAAGNTAAEVNSVVNYAVGVTPLQVKRRVEQRLDAIQRDHDRQLRAALNE